MCLHSLCHLNAEADALTPQTSEASGTCAAPLPGEAEVRGLAGLWLVSCLIQEATFQLGRREDLLGEHG